MKESDNGKEIEKLKKQLSQKNRKIRELKKINLFFGSLYDGVSEEIMVIDQDFIIHDVNRAFLEKTGLEKKDVVGCKCSGLKQRKWMPCISGSGACPAEKAGITGESVEMTHSYEDEGGNTQEHILIMYPLKPEDEEIKYFLEITRDVTEYRHLILRLQRSEKRFKAILDTATDAIISIDENHRIILFNNAAQKIFGYQGHEAIGKDLSIIIPPGFGKHQKYFNRFLKDRESDKMGKTIPLKAVRKNGEIFPIELSLSILEMEKKMTVTAIIRDVTSQRQLERKMLQAERLAAVGQAVAHVAHEIKNPLMIIGGFSSQIRSSLEREKDLNKLDMLLDEVARLERLVASLGNFTKDYKLVIRPADINSVISDVINIITGVYSPEKYRFVPELCPDIAEITCDPDKLKQVFINIISNGCEAMSSGGTVKISTEKVPGGIEIRISDEGSGISPDELKNIFEPFYTTREKGSGLGLAISYKLIQAHSGDIWAVSTPGRGTTFFIQLPDTL